MNKTTKRPKDYTVAFCDYAGRIHKGSGILAKSTGEAIHTCLEWIFEHRDDARECSIAYVMDTKTEKMLYGIDPTGMFTCDQTPVTVPIAG